MPLRELKVPEVSLLDECLTALDNHHNAVSTHFRGSYPAHPHATTIQEFADELSEGKARIAVVEEQRHVAGFCKIDIVGSEGYIDYLVVLPEQRRQHHGSELMAWALDAFRTHGVTRVQLCAIEGNASAMAFYERFGFRCKTREMELAL